MKVAVITGAGSGLGKSLGELLLKEGHTVVNGSRKENKEEIFVFIKTDVTKEKDCIRLFSEVMKRFGRVDILVNNAGVYFPDNIETMTGETLKGNTETNLYGTVYCTREAVRIMKAQGFGQIVNISSSTGISFRGDAKSSGQDYLTYSASKWAVVGVSGSVRRHVEGSGVDVICVCPGGVRTALFRHNRGRNLSGYMAPEDAAKKILEAIERRDKTKWLFHIPKDLKMKSYGFDDYLAK